MRKPTFFAAILIHLCFMPTASRVRKFPSDHAWFPLDRILDSIEMRMDDKDPEVISPESLNNLAGSLILGGKYATAERTISTSLRLNPGQGDALYLLGSLRCAMSRLGDARDAYFKAYHARPVSNSFEVAAINSDSCAPLPLLFPSDSVSHERSYAIFPHYIHTERHYLVEATEPRSRLELTEESAGALVPAADGGMQAWMAGLQAGADTDTPLPAAWEGETMIKQSSGDAAGREGVVLCALGRVGGGKFRELFPAVIQNEDLALETARSAGVWSAYEVELVRQVAAKTEVNAMAGEGDLVGVGRFLGGCLAILEALQGAGVVHNALSAYALLVSSAGSPVLVDAEIAAAPGLPPPSSASMQHPRDLHAHGRPSDAHSLGRSLERMLHEANVTAFDCVLKLLVEAVDDAVKHPHVTRRPHPSMAATYPVVDVERVRAALAEVLRALEAGERVPMHRRCSVPRQLGWSAYYEELPSDQKFQAGQDPYGLGLEMAGAPPFEHNMAMFELDTLLMNGSGIAEQRLGDFFYNMGSELSSVQEDASAMFEEAIRGRLWYKAVARSNLLVSGNALCCWGRNAEGVAHQHAAIKNHTLCALGAARYCGWSRALVVPSIDALAQDLDLDELLLLHKAWGDWFYSRPPPVEWYFFGHEAALRLPERRLKVVYASSHTWMNHGSHMTLMSMFGHHDPRKLEVIHFIMVGDQDIAKAGDLPERQEFIDIAHISDRDAARILNERGVHLFVDFNGYLSGTRMTIAAMDPCPICIHHFAQPSTMGARYVHNFLADTVIVPPEQARHYTEKLVYLPSIFLSTSARTHTPEALSWGPYSPLARSGLDLPTHPATLLCNFNAFYKIQPQQMAVWTRVMQQHPHTLLVLRAKYGAPAQCILDTLADEGLSADRVHFTGDLSGEAHSKRCGACDLVVDTDNFNGITTTATVLWTGTPVVTFPTANNAGRCSATMLLSMRAPELVARNREDYETLLRRLVEPAMAPALLRLRARISEQRVITPLYRPEYLAKGFERLAYALWEAFRAEGNRPQTHHVILPATAEHY